MAAGIDVSCALIQRSVSDGTWSAYSKVWGVWERLLSSLAVSAGDLELVLLFHIGTLFSDGHSTASLGRVLSALAFWFKLRGLPDQTKSFLVRQAVRGFRKGFRVRDARRPVSFDLLLRLSSVLEAVCLDAFEVSLFRCAFSLAFFGAFRISELVSPSRVTAGGLCFVDVCGDGEALHCFLRRSKTDQQGRGARVSLGKLPGSPVCPVRSFLDYCSMRPSGPSPFLVHLDGSFLSKFQFVQVFRMGLRHLGLSAQEFSSHSFRIGAATEAARWGLGPEVVRRIGRWESDRYRLYVRPHLL